MTRLNIELKNFSFFGRETQTVCDEIIDLLAAGHRVTIFFETSTGTVQDFYEIHERIVRGMGVSEDVQTSYGFTIETKYSNSPAQLHLTLWLEEVSE